MIDGVTHDAGEISGPRSRVKHIYRILLEHVKPAKPQTATEYITQVQVNELWERLNRLEA